METLTLKAQPRTAVGTRAVRALRESGLLPAIIYGHGEAPEPVSLPGHDVVVALAHGARTVQLDIGGKKGRYLIKEVQYDHRAEEPIHLDLARVSLDERVTVRVAIELRGTPKGASDGGILEQQLTGIEVECIVTDIPETLHPLVTELGVGDSLLVKDLELPPGVVAQVDPEERVATVKAAEAVTEAIEPEEAEEKPEGEEEPELIGRAKKDEDADESKS
ncbi:MAG: 50S ribosomal protein L25 [Phycisphaerae bacterium]|jgi:large subunit ribosomal protein L25